MSLETRNFYPTLTRHVTPTASGSAVVSYTSDLGDGGPILTLIHGYPQSSFIWRHAVPLLLGKVSLFIPELPGYGISSPASEHSKKVVGGALLDALKQVFAIMDESPRNIILGGHDRGARVCHRLAVDKDEFLPALKVVGTIMLDIVPTKVQWDKFSDPEVSQNYFHWPLLANVEIAIRMIQGFGAADWVRGGHFRLAGSGEGLRRLAADDAVNVHAALFEKEETLRGSCQDYAAGAKPEYDEQVHDQEAGRKVAVPAMVMFSQARLGAKIDVAGEWKDWIAEGVPFEPVPIGEGCGHYLPEEAYDIVVDKILAFLDKHT
ncbi:alpha/beta hydrolase [Podospora didyma]|uniref:Alpha/beta hydrolase n=1 Tax=Podospora didyma TaxID=330526 RepID=A0AAE0NQ55_9PEZI|nr:alpha/beta hydrolase [Podospora didyma]